MQQLLADTISATRAAGEAIMQFYQSQYTVADKSPDNPVTDADFAADKLLHEQLLALLPEAGWLSEETADDPARLERRLVWVVDPEARTVALHAPGRAPRMLGEGDAMGLKLLLKRLIASSDPGMPDLWSPE